MSKQIIAGGVAIGGGAPVTIQSMCNTHTEDAEATIAQIHALEAAGCEIVRVTVPTMEAAHALSKIRENISIPLVADIHFDYRLAVEAAARGADKIRINPGNIGGEDRVKAVVDACRKHKVPIRIGVNGGSLEKELLAKYGRVTPEALVESALRHVRLLEKFDFTDICLSVKSSDVPLNMAAYRLLHEKVDYPLHLGVTEAGTPSMGLLKSAIGIGGLLCEGIGDTMRVSLTADPVEEVYAAKRILQACGIRRSGVNLVSCPTCGRTAYNDPHRRGAGASAGGLQEEHHGCCDGLHRQRPGRGLGRRHRRGRRQGRGSDLPKRRDPLQSAAGKACGRADGGDRQALSAKREHFEIRLWLWHKRFHFLNYSPTFRRILTCASRSMPPWSPIWCLSRKSAR